MDENAGKKRRIRDLLQAVADNNPLAVQDFIDPNVTLYMDEKKASGRDLWICWVRYLHKQNIARLRIEDIRFIDENDNFFQLEGKVVCEKRSGGKKEGAMSLVYIFQGEKIVEIRSKRQNYKAIFGDRFPNAAVFLRHVLIMMLYRFLGKLDGD